MECFRYLSRSHKPCQRLPSGRHFIFLVCTVWMMCGSGYGFISDSINFYQFTYHSILHLRFYFCFALLLCIWTEDKFFLSLPLLPLLLCSACSAWWKKGLNKHPEYLNIRWSVYFVTKFDKGLLLVCLVIEKQTTS